MSTVFITSLISITAYLLAGTLLLRQFFNPAPAAVSAKVPQLSMMLGILAHLLILVLSLYHLGNEKLSLSFVTLTLAFLVTISMFFLNQYIKNLVFLPIVCLLSSLFVFLNIVLPSTTNIDANMNAGMIAHISLSIIAFGLLSISALYALQLSYINYQLKHKRKTMLHSDLPPLLLVEDILYKLMLAGTIVLGTSLVSGFIFLPNMFAEGYAHKTILSSVALLIFSVSLIFHRWQGLKARHAVVINVIGLSILALAYFGSRIVQEFIIG
ncbi:cytochrome C assembly family protein [Agaribacter flavus]|uniref:Inner membrane protein YpjD n=1 Tax=Agaribacter flavus TaxID=1902781 RepID=A0ABV7FX16_9ALTE